MKVKHPYIIASLASTLLAIIVWILSPKEYSAYTLLSDETKEEEFAVGTSKIELYLRLKQEISNEGINKIDVYHKVLKSLDFARKVAKKRGLDVSLAEEISENINFNISYKNQTLKIEYTDENPDVAASMLQSVVDELQQFVDEERYKEEKTKLEFYTIQKDSLQILYEEAKEDFSKYADSNQNLFNPSAQALVDDLGNKMNLYKKLYDESKMKCDRHSLLSERNYFSFAVIKPITTPVNDNSHPIAMIVCFNVIVLLLLKGYFLFKKNKEAISSNFDFGNILSPWNLTICIWVIILILLAFDEILDPLSTQFYVSLSIWLLIFLPVSLITCNLLVPKNQIEKPHNFSTNIDINTRLFNFLFAIALLCTPLYAYEVYKLISLFVVDDLMKAIRQLATFGDGYGLLNMVLVLDMALMIVAVWRYPKIPLWQLLVLIVLWILLCICNMAKVLFFIMFITIIYALYDRKKISLRSIIISSGTLFLLFYLFTLSREGGDFETEETLLDFLGTYVLSGSVAYGHVNPNISEFFGQNVFWVLSYYGTKFFGLQEVPMIQFQDFINVPVETNVYTLFRPYFADFGQIGVAMAAFIYGMVSGVIYRFARFGNAFAKCFYTYIIYILVMQFFDDVVVSSLLLITQLAFLLYILVQKSVTIKI